MGLFYYIVNEDKKEFIDSMNKFGELQGNTDVMETLIILLNKDWDNNRIRLNIGHPNEYPNDNPPTYKPITIGEENSIRNNQKTKRRKN